MKVFVQGQGAVTLAKSDFLASGGEGDVYVKGSTAFKIYHDPKKVISPAKVQELSAIQDPNINRPAKMLLDQANHPIGYTTRFIDKAHVLCELFPPAFRQRNNIDEQRTLALVQDLQKHVGAVHRAGVLIVDLNEMNWLVDTGFSEVYGIDVDSYQTRSFPATAIMPSVRDPQVHGLDFSELSDWYSFAIVSFNLFTGIHPFKGKHTSVKGFEDRMKANLSVLNPDVTVPKVVLPFSVIPDVYLQWYRAVFEQGKRMVPPAGLYATITVQPLVRQISGTNNFDIALMWEGTADIQNVWSYLSPLVWTNEELVFGKRPLYGQVLGVQGVGFAPRSLHPVVAGVSNGMLRLFDAEAKKELPITMRADEVMSLNGRIYTRAADKVTEILLFENGPTVTAGPHLATMCMPLASRLFPGVLVQNMLGTTRVTVFPTTKETRSFRVAELEGVRLVEAKYDVADNGTGVLMALVHNKGKYDRLVFRFAPDFGSYDVRRVDDVAHVGLNFVVLPSGICVCLNENEKLEVFSEKKDSASLKLIDDPVLGGDMRLYRNGSAVLFAKGNKLYSMRMK